MSQVIVNEIFYSIQGESSHMGRPCVFVRLTACNLRCSYCDTVYAFTEGTPVAVEEVIGRVESYGCSLVEITGGEPLLQEGVYPLMTGLCDRGYEVLLETGGSIDISRVDGRVRKIMDLKCPSSGMEEKNLWSNVTLIRPSDEIKFVIGNREDFDWALAVGGRYDLFGRCHVLMSPVFGVLEPAVLAGWILENRLPIRLQLQLHRFIWEPHTRGV